MKRAWLATCAALAACLVAAFALPACGAEDELAQDDASGWLTQAQNAHGRVDEALAAGRTDVAIDVLHTVLEYPPPREVAAEHGRVVQQDLWFRLATVELGATPEQALNDAERGLGLGRRDDLFCSNLLVARGRALQALGRDTEAASSYHEALAIDERLLQAVLRRGQAGGP